MIARFEALGNKTTEELIQLGFDPNTTINPQVLIDTMKTYSKFYDEAIASKRSAPKGSTKEEIIEFEREDGNRIANLYGFKSRAHSARKISEEYLKNYT